MERPPDEQVHDDPAIDGAPIDGAPIDDAPAPPVDESGSNDTVERVKAEIERAQAAGDGERLSALESIYRTLEEEVEQTASTGR